MKVTLTPLVAGCKSSRRSCRRRRRRRHSSCSRSTFSRTVQVAVVVLVDAVTVAVFMNIAKKNKLEQSSYFTVTFLLISISSHRSKHKMR